MNYQNSTSHMCDQNPNLDFSKAYGRPKQIVFWFSIPMILLNLCFVIFMTWHTCFG